MPAVKCFVPVSPGIFCGVARQPSVLHVSSLADGSTPRIPFADRPQQYTLPSCSTTHAKSLPAATSSTTFPHLPAVHANAPLHACPHCPQFFASLLVSLASGHAPSAESA